MNIGDSTNIEKQMPFLANEIIAKYKPLEDKNTYLNNLFKLQVVAGRYNEALATITSLRSIAKAGNQQFPDLLYVQYD
jgi:hypothetical protein